MTRLPQINKLMDVTTDAHKFRESGEIATEQFCGVMQHTSAVALLAIAEILDEMNEREKSASSSENVDALAGELFHKFMSSEVGGVVNETIAGEDDAP